ncbi:MAG: hypothetical protein D6730_01005 [Bacteroidetes bacterium]|nr:MAG: hypothetical protein D6730_01005 [Bacteroidota bacterium]
MQGRSWQAVLQIPTSQTQLFHSPCMNFGASGHNQQTYAQTVGKKLPQIRNQLFIFVGQKILAFLRALKKLKEQLSLPVCI